QADCNDIENLCWTKIALDVHRGIDGVEPALAKLDDAILRAQENRSSVNWVRPAPVRNALSALALATDERNYFRLPGQGSSSPMGNGELRTNNGQRTTDNGRRRAPILSRLGGWFRGLAVKAVGQLRQPPPFSAVHIARASDYNADLAG